MVNGGSNRVSAVNVSNFKTDLPDQTGLHVLVDIGYDLFFQKFELVNPGGAGYIDNQYPVFKGVGFGIHGNGPAHGSVPDIPYPCHIRVLGRAVFFQGGCKDVTDMDQLMIGIFGIHLPYPWFL